MLRIAAVILLSLVVLPDEALADRPRLLDAAAMIVNVTVAPDLVTAYSTTMNRNRLTLMARQGNANLATPLGPMSLLKEFRAWTWRAEDGSLLQGFAGNGGFRLTLGNCLAKMCSASECSDDGWPVFKCSDGRRRKMVVVDFATAKFDGVAYRRLSAPPKDLDKTIEAAQSERGWTAHGGSILTPHCLTANNCARLSH
jgi:hypothetical protein